VRFTGTAEFVASSERVWGFLIDVSRFGPCSPVPIARVDDTHFKAQAQLGKGLFSATIKVDLEVADVVAGRSATLLARGGASGTNLEGTTTFSIRPAGADGGANGRTTVDWETEIRLTGMFAGQAARMIEEHAPNAIQELLQCIHRQVEG
jgi:carbon monoxide dehydrogenase subunit G